MAERLVLCTDLDGTVVPDGRAEESAQARPTLARLAARPEVSLVYASGRDRGRIEAAIEEYDLPRPDFAIADVGSTIYTVTETGWQRWDSWARHIATDWGGSDGAALAERLGPIPALTLQESDRQGRHKLSFYADVDRADDDRPDLAESECAGELVRRLGHLAVVARQIWSRDAAGRGLVDVLPRRAGKLAALRFLISDAGIDQREVVFAGDSGNDLDALSSGLAAVLVGNAAEEVRREVRRRVRHAGYPDRLYLAAGGFLGMNGNYAAGVLEGVAYFHPRAARWLSAGP